MANDRSPLLEGGKMNEHRRDQERFYPVLENNDGRSLCMSLNVQNQKLETNMVKQNY